MIDLNAPIIPGESAAGIRIGQHIGEVLRQHKPRLIQKLEGFVRYEFGPVWIWTRDDLADQIGLYQGYEGALPEGVKIGSQMLDVKERIGKIYEDDEDNLRVMDSRGWCFETSRWNDGQDIDANLSAIIIGIFVFAEPQQ